MIQRMYDDEDDDDDDREKHSIMRVSIRLFAVNHAVYYMVRFKTN